MRRRTKHTLRLEATLARLLTIALVLILAVNILSHDAQAQNTYIITDGESVTYHTTWATDPDEVLGEAGFELGSQDTYTTQNGNGVSEIHVQRTQTITVQNGGEEIVVQSQGETVGDLLSRLNVAIDAQTSVSSPLDAQTSDGMELVINRTWVATETYTQTIPYEVRQLSDDQLAQGESRVLTAGSDGEMVCTAQVTYVNGVEIQRTVLTSQVTKAPVDELVAMGASAMEVESGELRIGDGVIITPEGDVLTYTGTMEVEATAYNHDDEGCDMWTATNTYVRWGTVAVDPRLIPYGTQMYIVSNDGSYIYGLSTAEDCGGAIKGNRIDLYMPTKTECFDFGRRDCTIYFLG